jgi:hypothetical protein
MTNQQDSHNPDARTELSAQRARQGVTGHNVRYVLAFGIVGVIIAFAVVYLSFFA